MKRLALVLFALAALAAAAGAVAARQAAPTGTCVSPGTAGSEGQWKVLLGVRTSLTSAQALVRTAQHYGFRNLEIEIQAPRRYAVALNGLTKRVQLTEELRQVRSVPKLKAVAIETVLAPCR